MRVTRASRNDDKNPHKPKPNVNGDVSEQLVRLRGDVSVIKQALAHISQVSDNILAIVTSVRRKETEMAGQLDDITAQVHSNSDAIDSAKALIQALADRIANNVNDPTALQALVDELRQKDQELADAVAANTPAAQP
jgi:chromosome segregation ATPase